MESALNFKKLDGLIPAVVQDHATGDVLMVGFMNEEAYRVSVETGRVTFWSRTRSRLWTKGESSGNVLRLVRIDPDCDGDSLLIRAEPAGPTCHTGARSCFGDGSLFSNGDVIRRLEGVVRDRQRSPRAGSYTSALFERGRLRMSQKVGEEAVETILAATQDDVTRLVSESADLVYHLTVLLVASGAGWSDVESELASRFARSPAEGRSPDVQG